MPKAGARRKSWCKDDGVSSKWRYYSGSEVPDSERPIKPKATVAAVAAAERANSPSQRVNVHKYRYYHSNSGDGRTNAAAAAALRSCGLADKDGGGAGAGGASGKWMCDAARLTSVIRRWLKQCSYSCCFVFGLSRADDVDEASELPVVVGCND